MKTQMSAALIAYLQSPASAHCLRANLFTLGLISGAVYTLTDAQLDLHYRGLTYYATQFGAWSLTQPIKSSLGFSSNETALGVYAPPSVVANGTNVALLTAIYLGLFEGCTLTVETVYMPTWDDTSLGTEIRFGGIQSGTPKMGRTEANLKFNDWSYILNLSVPNALISAPCNWVLYGAGCNIAASAFAHNGVLGFSSSMSTALNPNFPDFPIGPPAGYFSQGVVKFNTGPNAGLSYSIKLDQSGLFLAQKTFAVPFIGDQITAYAGCDHTLATCASKFSNAINFRGFPFVPVPESAI